MVVLSKYLRYIFARNWPDRASLRHNGWLLALRLLRGHEVVKRASVLLPLFYVKSAAHDLILLDSRWVALFQIAHTMRVSAFEPVSGHNVLGVTVLVPGRTWEVVHAQMTLDPKFQSQRAVRYCNRMAI